MLIMVLIYKSTQELQKYNLSTWVRDSKPYRGQDSKHPFRRTALAEKNGKYDSPPSRIDPTNRKCLAVSDLTRDIARYFDGQENPEKAYREFTVGQLLSLANDNYNDMTELYERMLKEPDLLSPCFVQGYTSDGKFIYESLIPAIGTAAYYRINQMYDEQLIDKVNDCIEIGYFDNDTLVRDAESIINANITNIRHITMDDIDAREVMLGFAREAKAMLNYENGRYYDDRFVQGKFVFETKPHLKAIFDVAINAQDGYLRPESENMTADEIKQKINRTYYEKQKHPVFNPDLAEKLAYANNRVDIIKNGLYDADYDYIPKDMIPYTSAPYNEQPEAMFDFSLD